ncbi:VOC family protein [Flavobacterium sp. ACAM 123]|jgi:glyoxylase I family protein|uniref:SMU1112c/YaeR family gloxylase I-like metalloprotein n=1 Tax=Flavobacterium sp. ACAM 123 TaxID=1189620 RepID=UPI00037C9C68|nr:VOC family protein [Flavobacterium sp. ACAM 123]
MLHLNKINHTALIYSNYQKSKPFYTQVSRQEVLEEIYRKERNSYKVDLALNVHYIVELFSFPKPPKRPSPPESCGLRHLVFEVDNVENTSSSLVVKNIPSVTIQTDEYTGKQYLFIAAPHDLPIEF